MGCRQVLGLEDVDCAPAYATAVDYPTAAGPRALGVGDLSGDGQLDLVTANSNASNVSRFYGLGDGTVMPKADHEAIDNPVDMVVGDVTGDGLVDVALLGNNNGLMVLYGKGAEGLSLLDIYDVDNGRDLEIADVDGNGILDLLGTSNGTTLPTAPAKLSVLLGQADGMLAQPVTVDAPDNPGVIRIADFTRDGILDVLLTSRSERPTVIRPGNGDGTFGDEIDTSFRLTTTSILVGDVNGDSNPDLVVTAVDAAATSTVAVTLGNGDGTFTAGANMATDLIASALTDLDGDGILDIVGYTVATEGDSTPSVGVKLGLGDGTFGATVSTPLSGSPVNAIAAKLDDDAIPELVAVLGTTNNIAIVNGRCSFAAE